jgi:exopolysaccharide biosynthesis polyprenyl glycosylphosphotransferase
MTVPRVAPPFDSSPFALPVPGQARRRVVKSEPIPGAALLVATETALALGILGALIIAMSVQQMPATLEHILGLRITLRNLLLLAIFATGWPLLFIVWRLYDTRTIEDATEERLRVCAAVTLGTLLAIGLTALSEPGGLRALDLLYFWAAATAATLGVRELRRIILRSSRAGQRRRVLIIGSGARALRMWHALANDHTASQELAGFVDCAGSVPASEDIARLCLGTLDQLESTLVRHTVDEACIALPIKSHYREIQEALLVCERVGVCTKYEADLFETQVAWARYERWGAPVVTMQVVPDDYRLVIKRIMDIVGAGVALVVSAPLMVAAAIAIKATSPGPVIFGQYRYGLNRRTFRMLKFRTMVANAEQLQGELERLNEAEGPVFKITGDPRVTRIGRFLRRTSIDELPQLFNVLRGEMSLVGPRPLPLRDVERFTSASDLRRFSVRPGLTCLWQISGRSNIGFREWVSLDLKYIDGWSLALDLAILLRTIPAVIRGTGAQ